MDYKVVGKISDLTIRNNSIENKLTSPSVFKIVMSSIGVSVVAFSLLGNVAEASNAAAVVDGFAHVDKYYNVFDSTMELIRFVI